MEQLLTALLERCSDESPRVQLACGECLGELGALDPGGKLRVRPPNQLRWEVLDDVRLCQALVEGEFVCYLSNQHVSNQDVS